MDAVLRGLAVYLFLLLAFRLSGKRAVSEVTTFDFVLLLIIAETTQQALLGNDYSVTNSFILIVTLMTLDIALSYLKEWMPALDKALDDVPLIVVEDGKPLEDRMNKARIDESEILAAGRRLQGLERMEQIKYAVLERNGGISIVPKKPSPV